MNTKNILKEVFGQLSDLLENLSAQEYAARLDLLSGSSIGMHVRHILEFMLCLEGISLGDCVCYDDRERSAVLEIDPEHALITLRDLLAGLESWPESAKVKLEGSYGCEGQSAYAVNTTLERELVYNIEHAVHHMAIIKIAMKHCYGHVALAENFGKAHSTVRYEMKMAK